MDLKIIGVSMGGWIDSAHVRDYWRALVNAVLNHRVLKSMELACSLKWRYEKKLNTMKIDEISNFVRWRNSH